MDRRQQLAATAERYREMARDRKGLKRGRRPRGSGWWVRPSGFGPGPHAWPQTGQLQPEALVKGIASAEQPERHILLEGIIGATNDLEGVNFLTEVIT
jgi:hypothetical protein